VREGVDAGHPPTRGDVSLPANGLISNLYNEEEIIRLTVSECECTENTPINTTNVNPPHLDPRLSLTRSLMVHHFNEGFIAHPPKAAPNT
jgi:hypothetical protein